MKSKDIKIGMRVWTNISQDCVLVEVIEDREMRGRRYTVKRIDNGKVLSTGRAPAALHETKGPWVKNWGSVLDMQAILLQQRPWIKL